MTIRVYRNGELAFELNRPTDLNQIIQDDTSDEFTFDAGDLAAWQAQERMQAVRAEAQRRMMVLLGARNKDHLSLIIANGSRESVRLLRKGATEWTAEEAERATHLEQLDVAIEAIRTASNALEAMEPVPDDFLEDGYWNGMP